MSFVPNWKTAKYKSKEDAIAKMVIMIGETPGCAGVHGEVGISVLKNFFLMRPPKKKQREQE